VSVQATPVPTASTHDQVVAWYANGGETRVEALARDEKAANAAVSSGDWDKVESACTTLLTSLQLVQAYAPFPDDVG
jgi:hypothetical protein